MNVILYFDRNIAYKKRKGIKKQIIDILDTIPIYKKGTGSLVAMKGIDPEMMYRNINEKEFEEVKDFINKSKLKNSLRLEKSTKSGSSKIMESFEEAVKKIS